MSGVNVAQTNSKATAFEVLTLKRISPLVKLEVLTFTLFRQQDCSKSQNKLTRQSTNSSYKIEDTSHSNMLSLMTSSDKKRITHNRLSNKKSKSGKTHVAKKAAPVDRKIDKGQCYEQSKTYFSC